MLKSGKKIDILKVEPPVTPSVILGYSEEERIKSKFTLFENKLYSFGGSQLVVNTL